jgi:glycosyltransferase involved in cell wall biosynthesis
MKGKHMNKRPLVSVIVPTLNSQNTLEQCLASIAAQTYDHVELIVVDNFSTDQTLTIAKRFTPKVFTEGPERSAQVNYGVAQATGEFVYKVDSDFILDPDVIQQCVDKAAEGFDAVVVHNSPDESVSWIAKVRKFEVDMYKYDITHSSARFVRKNVYQKIGGFDPAVTAGEDYDFQNKLNRAGFRTGFVDAEALHLGEPKKLWPHLKKYHVYGRDFVNYTSTNKQETSSQLGFVRSVYVRHWRRFVSHPLMAIAFIGYNLLKYFAGGTGYTIGLLQRRVRGTEQT